MTNSSGIRFRNVHIKSESGYAVCDANGCGRFLRAGKFPFDNAVQDVTRHLEVRDREFAVLDVPATVVASPARAGAVRRRRRWSSSRQASSRSPAPPSMPPARSTSSITTSSGSSPGQRARPGRRARRAARSVNLAVAKSGDVLVVSSAGPDGTVYSFDPREAGRRAHRPQSAAGGSAPDAAAVLPVNVWVNGELEDQLDLGTYEYVTLAQLFAREVATPAPRQYVPPDGSLVLPAGRVFEQPGVDSYAGMDETGWRWSHTLDAYGLSDRFRRTACLRRERRREPHLSRDRAGRRHARQSAAVRRARRRGASPRTAPATSTSRTARSSSTTRPAGLPGGSTCRSGPVQILFGGADRRTLFILTHHTLYSVTTRGAGRPGAVAEKNEATR